MRQILCFASIAVALAACSPKAGDKAPAAAGPTAGAGQALGDPVVAGGPQPDQPQRRPGLWRVTLTALGRDGVSHSFETRMCLDAATDALAPIAGPAGGAGRPDGGGAQACARASSRASGPGGDRSSFQSRCDRGGRVVTVQATATGDFDRAYTVDTITRISADGTGDAPERRSLVAAQWMGACPAPMAPGDVVGAGGVTYRLGAEPAPDKASAQPPTGRYHAEAGTGDGSAHGPNAR